MATGKALLEAMSGGMALLEAAGGGIPLLDAIGGGRRGGCGSWEGFVRGFPSNVIASFRASFFDFGVSESATKDVSSRQIVGDVHDSQ